MTTGILVTNIGTPDSYEVSDVRRYLKTFLMDKNIISIPYLIRWLLVHGIIVPKRAAFSAENYKKVWTSEGSPLLVYTKRFQQKLQQKLGSQFIVEFGMSYSNPNIEAGLQKLHSRGVDHIIVIPLYPQFAQATTGSAIEDTQKAVAKLGIKTKISFAPDFYDADFFIDAQARLAIESLEKASKDFAAVDHWVFSFHGLPESQIKKDKACSLNLDCCSRQSSCTRRCYRAQCFATAKKLAAKMKLSDSNYTVTFQSRLGKAEWIKPYTDKTVQKLAESGIKNLGMISPAFVTDCIETLEELAIGVKETFEEHGGHYFHLAPCVNDDALWVDGFAEWVHQLSTDNLRPRE